jgi:hypothetical protein
MGDFATLDKNKLKAADTLFVQRYLCGYSGQNAITTLTIKNAQNEILQESINHDNHFMFTGKMPISEILNSEKVKSDEYVAIYFTIDSKAEDVNEQVLLGSLRLE